MNNRQTDRKDVKYPTNDYLIQDRSNEWWDRIYRNSNAVIAYECNQVLLSAIDGLTDSLHHSDRSFQPIGIDIGGGTGAKQKVLMSKGLQVISHDISRFAVEEATGISGRGIVSQMFEIPLDDNRLDFVTCFRAIHNAPAYVRRSLLEFKRILKPGGFLLLSVRADCDPHLGNIFRRFKEDTFIDTDYLSALNKNHRYPYFVSNIAGMVMRVYCIEEIVTPAGIAFAYLYEIPGNVLTKGIYNQQAFRKLLESLRFEVCDMYESVEHQVSYDERSRPEMDNHYYVYLCRRTS